MAATVSFKVWGQEMEDLIVDGKGLAGGFDSQRACCRAAIAPAGRDPVCPLVLVDAAPAGLAVETRACQA